MKELQNTEEWHVARLGKATGSRMGDVMAKIKDGQASASRKNYRAELVSERNTGIPWPHYVTPEMQRGLDKQPLAMAEYERRAKMLVGAVGFVPHPTIAMAGCSPDGLVCDDGVVEFKCPNLAQHIDQLLDPEGIALRYIWQIQFILACTGRRWCDFVSFDDRMQSAKQYICWRIARNEAAIRALETEVIKFLDEVTLICGKLDVMYPEQIT